jgi:hypothetical protein
MQAGGTNPYGKGRLRFSYEKSTFPNKKPNISTNLAKKYSIMIRDKTRQ